MSEYKIDFNMLTPDDSFLKTIAESIAPRYPKSVVDNLVEEARKAGREEAWDLARRIAVAGPDCYSIFEVTEAFGNEAFGNLDILRTPVEEVLAKDKEYQEKKKALHVGDEVMYEDCATDVTLKGFVLGVNDSGVRIMRLSLNNIPVITYWDKGACKKTGNHNPDIVKVLEALKEESDAAKDS